jgi:hypothetical protein
MSAYVPLQTSEGVILVEVSDGPRTAVQGEQPAGLRSWARERAQSAVEQAQSAVEQAQTTFEQALERMVRLNVEPFLRAVQELPRQPAEMEMSFALKVSGELSNLAVGKLGGESHYQVKLVWKQQPPRNGDGA